MIRLAPTVALLLGGCVTPPAAETRGPYRYSCEGILAPVEAIFHNGRKPFVALSIGQAISRLPQTRSASGARYSDGKHIFWVKGRDATLEGPGNPYLRCKGL